MPSYNHAKSVTVVLLALAIAGNFVTVVATPDSRLWDGARYVVSFGLIASAAVTAFLWVALHRRRR